MAKEKDMIKVGPEIAPGLHQAIRQRGDETEMLTVRPIKDGDPILPGDDEAIIAGEACVHGWREVAGTYKSGPVMANSRAFVNNYDAIFGKKPVGEA